MSEQDGPHTNLGLSRDLRIIADHLDHCEGLCWDPTRERVLVGTETGVLRAVDINTGQNEEVGKLPGWILGLAVDAAGSAVCCVVAGSDTGVWISHPDGSAEKLETDPIVFPNYLAFGPDGTLYVTDSGNFGEHDGRVLKVSPSGTTEVLTDETPKFTNGCAVHPDGSELWVIESFGPSISAVNLSSGAARQVGYIHGTVPDGIAFCDDRSAVVTSYRPDRLYHLKPDGQNTVIAEDLYGALLNAPTNCCFAGPDLDRLIAVNFGRWHLTQVTSPLRGAQLNYPESWAGNRT